MITDEEAQQLMCPPSPVPPTAATKDAPSISKKKTLQRMNSFHVGPVKLPHPVRMPNGRLRNNSDEFSRTVTAKVQPPKKGLRSYSLRYGTTLDDFHMMEKPIFEPINTQTTIEEKPKVKTVPLYIPKRSSNARMSSGSCQVAIEEMASHSHASKLTSNSCILRISCNNSAQLLEYKRASKVLSGECPLKRAL